MSVCTMRLKGLTVVDLRRDSAMPESELSPLRSLLRRLTAVLIGLSVLCLAGCASTRQATSSLQLTAYGLQEDGTPTISSKLSAVSKIMKWIFWILIGLIGLIVTVKVCHRR